MHEISIINSIIKTLDMEFEVEKVQQMKAIYLKVGKLSNIEPRLLHNAFDAYNYDNATYQNVALHIQLIDIKIKCESCDHITQVQNYRFICDNCQRPSKNIIEGKEMLIHKVEFED